MFTPLKLLTARLMMSFVATPHHSMDVLIGGSDLRSERNALKLKAYDPGFPVDPGFPRDDPPPDLPQTPVKPIPTDVPVPEPHDAPAPEPRDVPPPDVGKPAPQKAPDQPRPVP